MFIDPVQLRNNPGITGFRRLGFWTWQPDAPQEFSVSEAEAMVGLEGLVQVGWLEPITVGYGTHLETQLIVHPRLANGARFIADAIEISKNPPVFPPDLEKLEPASQLDDLAHPPTRVAQARRRGIQH